MLQSAIPAFNFASSACFSSLGCEVDVRLARKAHVFDPETVFVGTCQETANARFCNMHMSCVVLIKLQEKHPNEPRLREEAWIQQTTKVLLDRTSAVNAARSESKSV